MGEDRMYPMSSEMAELLNRACALANSVQDDVEENPESVSNQTMIALQEFVEKFEEINGVLENENGIQ